MDKIPEFKPKDKVKFRTDATTDEGRGREPIGPIFMELTWEVVHQNGNAIELKSKLEETELKFHTLAHKLYLLERPGAN